MRHVFVGVLIAVGLAGLAPALTVTCTSGPVNVTGSSPLTILCGSTTFSNFSIDGVGGVPGASGNTNVQVTYSLASGYSVLFTAESAALWTVTGGQQFNFTVHYDVLELNAVGFGDFRTFAGNVQDNANAAGGGNSRLDKDINGDLGVGHFVSVSTNPVFNNSPLPFSVVSNSSPAGTTFRANDNIQVSSMLGSSASLVLTSFGNVFVVPEPMTMPLVGVALVALGLIGRRLRK